jgi:hypothetical protein
MNLERLSEQTQELTLELIEKASSIDFAAEIDSINLMQSKLMDAKRIITCVEAADFIKKYLHCGGKFYNELKDTKLNAKKLETEIAKLMQDEEVTNPKGIYEYVLNGNERALNIRAFTDKQKRETYEKQKGICPKCKKHFEIKEMEADHRDLWSEGGKTITENCQMLCKADHREKSGK